MDFDTIVLDVEGIFMSRPIDGKMNADAILICVMESLLILTKRKYCLMTRWFGKVDAILSNADAIILNVDAILCILTP